MCYMLVLTKTKWYFYSRPAFPKLNDYSCAVLEPDICTGVVFSKLTDYSSAVL